MNVNGPADAGPLNTQVRLAGCYEHFASALLDAELCAGGVGFGT